jgi:membrane protease YdiL (CAAX protease family)
MKLSKDSLITLTLFFILTIALYFLGYWLIYRMAKSTPLMLSVGVAAILTCLIRKRRLKTLGWNWRGWKYAWMSYLVPLGLIAIAYIIIWLAGFGQWYDVDFITEQKSNYNLSQWSDFSIILFHLILTASISFFISLPSVLGEEIAWRGFLVPELSKMMNFTGVALFSGFIWALWHWPLFINGLYGNNTTPLVFQLGFFTLFIMSSSMIMTYLRYKTNSVWTAVIYHMSSNVFIQKFFTPLTLTDDQSSWYLDEFGLILPVVVLIAAIYFWKKGQKEFTNKDLLEEISNNYESLSTTKLKII